VQIEYKLDPDITNEELQALFANAWPDKGPNRDYAPILSRSLGYICAYMRDELIGFVYVAWDGGIHAFLLDPTVHSDVQRRGIGTELVRRAKDLAKSKGAEWLHVDYEPQLAPFYRKCGFVKTEAGLINLKS
jgi:GNAT superfamily N-acetyltransferase